MSKRAWKSLAIYGGAFWLLVAGVAVGASYTSLFGGSGGSGRTYLLASTKPCLNDLGVTTGTVDAIAEQARGGATDLVVDGEDVQVLFGETADEAKALYREYAILPHEGGSLILDGNAVIAWDYRPQAPEAAAVKACLR